MTTPTTVQVQIQLRADTAANWASENPTLLANEVGLETDTKKLKVGDGTTAWNTLAYFPSIVTGGTVLGNLEIGTTGTLTFEGSTADGFETTLAVTDPTADRTITLPDQSGTVVVTGNASIVDADIAANAEIAVSKLADGAARQLLQTDAAGTGVEWASNIDVPGTLDVTGAATFDDDVTIEGDLTVNGTTTTIDTETLLVKDKNIELAVVDTPTDLTADGGGITLKGATDKTLTWSDTTDAWTISEHVDIASGKEYRINNTKVLDATSLGSAVVSSSLTSVGTIGTGVWEGTAIDATYLDSTVVTTSDIGTVTGTMLADGTIVDADISASAEIAVSKLADGSARQLLQTDAAGTGVEWTDNVDIPGTLDVTGAATFDGDLTVDTNTLHVDSTNNRVGIGTASPSTALELSGVTDPVVRVNRTIAGQYGEFSGISGAANINGVNGNGGAIIFRGDGNERARIDTGGRLLKGTTTALNNIYTGTTALTPSFQLFGDTSEKAAMAIVGDGSAARLLLNRGTTIVSDGNLVGGLEFNGFDGSNYRTLARIQGYVNGTPGADDMPGAVVFATTPDGSASPTERLRIDSAGLLYSVPTYNNTTGTTTNYLRIGSDGQIYRSTSSIAYKTDVEDMEDAYADAILNLRPVWYRSTCQSDNPDHSHWGFIAEEVEKVDPRLCSFKDVEVTYDEEGSPVVTPLDAPVVDGVDYASLTPLLLNLIKRQKAQIEDMEVRLAALEGGAS